MEHRNVQCIKSIDLYLTLDHFSDHYKLRGGVYFVNSLPFTPSGKLLRKKVKQMAIELFNTRVADDTTNN